MTKEMIDYFAIKFDRYCGVAEERYKEPKYEFAALLTLIDVLGEGAAKQCADEQKEPSADLSVSETILGVVPLTDIEKKVLKILVELGCESLSEVKGLWCLIDPRLFQHIFLIGIKGRKTQLPSQWDKDYTTTLNLIMHSQGLYL